MRVEVLGPLSVTDAVQTVPTGQIERRVLAVLAAEANRAVHVDRLADLVWHDGPPPRGNSVQAHISRWRKAVGAHHVSYAPAGYTLHVTATELDAAQFTDEVVVARGHRDGRDLTAAIEAYDRALALWRGPAFGDLAGDDCVRARAAELEAMRSTIRLERLDALCQIDAYEQVVADAVPLGQAEPWNESVHRLLARAHYGAGDQVTALEILAGLEQRLRHDLGLDLGPPSHLLREQILRQEPALDLRAPSPRGADPVPTARLEQRLTAFTPITRQVLHAASLSGLDVDTAQIRQALGLGGPAVADALVPVIASGILVRADDGIRFARAGIREAIIDLVPAGEALALHAQLGHGLLRRGRSTDILQRAAHHLSTAASIDSSTARHAVELDRRLADLALSQADHPAAARHARRALDSAEHIAAADGQEPIDEAGLWFLLGEARQRSADFDGAMAAYRAAAEAAGAGSSGGDAQVMIRSALAHEECSLHGRRHRTGAHDPSVFLLEEALRVVDSREMRAELLASLGQALTFVGAGVRAVRLAEEAVAAARQCDDPELLVRALLRCAAAHDPVTSTAQGFALVREAAELSRSIEADELELEALSVWVPELMRAGRLDEADAVIGRVEQLADLHDNVLHRYKVPMWRAAFALAAGRLDEAEILIEDFRRAGQSAGYDDTARTHGFQSILLELGRGRVDRATALVEVFADDVAFEPWQATRIAVAHAAGDAGAVRRSLDPWSARRFALSRPFVRVQTFCACLVAAAVAEHGDDAARARLAAIIAPAVGRNQVLGAGAAMLGDAADHLRLVAGGELT